MTIRPIAVESFNSKPKIHQRVFEIFQARPKVVDGLTTIAIHGAMPLMCSYKTHDYAWIHSLMTLGLWILQRNLLC